MPPTTGAGHYRLNNLSNPYNQYPQQHSQYQSQNNYNAHSFGTGHGGFAAAQPNPQMNIFGGGGLQNGAQTGAFGTAALQGAGGTGLASHEAQMRFAHGAALQRHGDAEATARATNLSTRIREVWATNMEEEFYTIRSLVDRYPFISMVGGSHPKHSSMDDMLMAGYRTPSFLALSRGQWAISRQKPTTITRLCAAMSTCSK